MDDPALSLPAAPPPVKYGRLRIDADALARLLGLAEGHDIVAADFEGSDIHLTIAGSDMPGDDPVTAPFIGAAA